VEEGFLGLPALLSSRAAVDEDDGFPPAEKSRDPAFEP